MVARTYLIDALVGQAVHEGVDAVVNLAAGFDARPYRLHLPDELCWVEVDHADVVAEKTERMQQQLPRCALERVALDLSEAGPRRALLAALGARFRRMLVLTEGLVAYLPEAAALELARDLAETSGVYRWVVDVLNGAVVRMINGRTGSVLSGSARMQFAPDRGPLVFEPLGWQTREAHSVFKTAGKLKRLPFFMSLMARLPEPPYGGNGARPWNGVCVLEPTK